MIVFMLLPRSKKEGEEEGEGKGLSHREDGSLGEGERSLAESNF
jgi:hypothetical protein